MQVHKDAPRRIRGALMIRGMSQRQLAKAMGYDAHSYINRLLSGQVRSIKPEAAARMAAILQAPMDDLFLPKVSMIPEQNVKLERRAS